MRAMRLTEISIKNRHWLKSLQVTNQWWEDNSQKWQCHFISGNSIGGGPTPKIPIKPNLKLWFHHRIGLFRVISQKMCRRGSVQTPAYVNTLGGVWSSYGISYNMLKATLGHLNILKIIRNSEYILTNKPNPGIWY